MAALPWKSREIGGKQLQKTQAGELEEAAAAPHVAKALPAVPLL